jgi:hypothetical protein
MMQKVTLSSGLNATRRYLLSLHVLLKLKEKSAIQSSSSYGLPRDNFLPFPSASSYDENKITEVES